MAAKKHAPIERIARETLTGDVRDFLLAFLKTHKDPLPWTSLSEKVQRQHIDEATTAADDVVQKVVEIVAGDGNTAIRGTVAGVTVKTKIKATIECEITDRNLLDLCHGAAVVVMLTVADKKAYEGERAPAVADPDQKELPTE